MWVRPGSRKCTWLSITPRAGYAARDTVDPLIGVRAGQASDPGDPAVAHADVALARAILVDDGPARQNEIERLPLA